MQKKTVVAIENGMLAIAGMFSILGEMLGIAKSHVHPIVAKEQVIIKATAKPGNSITVFLKDYRKSCKGTWERYINFSEPPKFNDELLFSPVFCGIEAFFTYLERNNVRTKGVTITLETPGLIGDPFGKQCLSADSATIAATVKALASLFSASKPDVNKILEIAENYRKNNDYNGVPVNAYSNSAERAENKMITTSLVLLNTGMCSYRGEFLMNLRLAQEANAKKINKQIDDGIVAEEMLIKAIKRNDSLLLLDAFKKYDNICEELREAANLKLGQRTDNMLNELRSVALLVPIEFNYSAFYVAIPKVKNNAKTIISIAKEYGFSVEMLKK